MFWKRNYAQQTSGILRGVGICLGMFGILALFWVFRLSGTMIHEKCVVASGESFSMPYDVVNAIGISCDDRFTTDYWGDLRTDITVRIMDASGTVVHEATALNAAPVRDYTIRQKELLEKPMAVKRGEIYTVTVESEELSLEPVTIALYGPEKSVFPYYLAVSLMIMAVTLFGCVLYFRRGRLSFRGRIVCLFLLLGLLWNFTVAPLNAPDEEVHFAKAYQLSSEFLQRDTVNGQGLLLVQGQGLKRLQFNGNMQYTVDFWSDTQGSDYENTEIYEIVPYVVTDLPYYLPAIGITLMRFFSAPYQWIVISGRILNLLFYAGILLASMKLIPPRFEKSVAAVFLLPGVLAIASSYSYDIWINAFSLLLFSYCMRCRERERGLRWTDWLLLIAIIMLLAPVKVIYILLVFTVFLIPKKRFAKKWQRWLLVGAMTVAGGMMILIVQGSSIAGMIGISVSDSDYSQAESVQTEELRMTESVQVASEEDILPVQESTVKNEATDSGEEEANISYSLDYVLRHPLKTLLVCVEDLFKETDYLIKQCLIGNGTPLHSAPDLMAFSVFTAFMVMMAGCLPDGYVGKRERAGGAVLLGLGLGSILVTFLFANSFVQEEGVGTILGIQGRYFVPYLLFLPFVFQTNRLTVREETKNRLLAFLALSNILVLLCCLPYIAGN
ncbi:MAG: DUF2142 domain-containing protein [Eubacteriales bacterium]|nr:DUF2142 domain-containing protein [Eubacteriales bacterium]